MKVIGLLIFAFFCSYGCSAQHLVRLTADAGSDVACEVVASDLTSLTLKITTAGFRFREVEVNGKIAKVIYGKHTSQLMEKGFPDLSKYVRAVALPSAGETTLEILEAEYTDLKDYEIAPSKGMLLASDKFSEIPYIYDPVYSTNEFWPREQVSLQKPYFLGQVRGQNLVVQPFSYNAVQKTMRIYTSLVVRIAFSGKEGNEHRLPDKKYSREFGEIIQNHFINPPQAYDVVDENGELLIICPQQWIPLMQSFVAWKTMKGIPVTLVDLSETGTTALSIKQYIEHFYLTHNLTHVLLAGDADVIPSMTAAGATGPSDPSYGFINGNDAYPEVFVGRFPAQTPSDLETMTERVIAYERYPDTTAAWYSNAAGIASNFGPGDDNEMDWEHLVNIRSQLLNYTYDAVAELYDGMHPGTTDLPGDPSSSDLFSIIEDGLSLINYTGHGTNTAFSTTGFSIAEISQLTNHNRLPFIWSAGCTNGNFTSVSPCMGEAFLRATNNGLPTGAIATLMSSVNQYWSPPMDAQDEMNAILTESYINNIKRTFAGISYNGCMKMNDNYGTAGELMTATWHCFGDPTLNVRTAQPVPLSVMHPASMHLGDTLLTAACSTEGAVVALTQNGNIIGTAAVINATAVIHFSPLLSLDSVTIVATGFNHHPYEGKIAVLTPPGPYIVAAGVINHEVAGNGDDSPDYGETIWCDLYICNAGGSASAGIVLVSVTTGDSVVTMIHGNSISLPLNSGDTLLIDSAFTYSIGWPFDQHKVTFNVIITDTLNSYHSAFGQLINAPLLSVKEVSVNDQAGNANGILEPGENADLSVAFRNSGKADAYSLTATITTDSLLFATTDTFYIPLLASDSTIYISFPVMLNPAVLPGEVYSFIAGIESGNYSSSKSFSKAAGYHSETFESGDLSQFDWVSTGTVPWFVSTLLPYSGAFCAQSGDIDNNESSTLMIELQCILEDSLTFIYKTSTEAVWDVLSLSVDSAVQRTWSGIIPWTKDGILLTPGLHTIEFTYAKDNILSAGLDCAWLDEIRFPPFSHIVSVNAVNVEHGLHCYPVPAGNTLHVNLHTDKDFTVSIMDMQGALIYKEVGAGKDGKCIIDVSAFADGTYIICAESGKRKYRQLISVIHP